jgi:hypothetical protein
MIIHVYEISSEYLSVLVITVSLETAYAHLTRFSLRRITVMLIASESSYIHAHCTQMYSCLAHSVSLMFVALKSFLVIERLSSDKSPLR